MIAEGRFNQRCNRRCKISLLVISFLHILEFVKEAHLDFDEDGDESIVIEGQSVQGVTVPPHSGAISKLGITLRNFESEKSIKTYQLLASTI